MSVMMVAVVLVMDVLMVMLAMPLVMVIMLVGVPMSMVTAMRSGGGLFGAHLRDIEAAAGQHAVVMRPHHSLYVVFQTGKTKVLLHDFSQIGPGVQNRGDKHIAGNAAQDIKMNMHRAFHPLSARKLQTRQIDAQGLARLSRSNGRLNRPLQHCH
ncbi:hypothetical protein MPLDJ20_20295 [Mesorhizobium plurifarium]|uniref:Uncharacterized protein n=1 Tax=Mesorhizobium plurifarium TaxID=69974 RepID=A0A090EVR5_MESPL|nr:hypothetical protein MPLDJ20_20295 [Mesorhizobium plurifarium]